MHLLAATPGAIDDGSEPFDLGQSPADVVILSAADSELAALSAARADMETPPTLRLANLTHLAHPMSVDLHLDHCATQSKLVIARILGGKPYWDYGLTQYAARLHAAGIPFAALPGDDKPDPELRALSSVAAADYDTLWSYFTEGGPENTANLLRLARSLSTGGERPPAAKPLLKAGLYWPASPMPDLESLRAQWPEDAPVVPVVFYRALMQSAGLDPINRLTRALLRQGLAPLPIFVASLKDPVSQATLASLFAEAPPDVILNATAFATGTPETPGENPFAATDAPVFQIVLSGGTEEAWEDSPSGLSARDIAMNVALPEVDGRILSRAVSFKGEAYFDEATECPIASYRAQGDRITFVADLARNWATLRRTPPAERKVAVILANYPNKDGRLANGVGLDTPTATANALSALAAAGYAVKNAPANGAALMERLTAGPTNWLTDRALRDGGERLPLARYSEHHGTLPWDAREAMNDRWGEPAADPFLDGDAFALSLHRFGNVVVGLQPARGYNIDPEDTYHSPDLVPPHNYLAFYQWLRDWGAHAVIHMGKHGNLEWLPGKALALSQGCWPEIALGPLPHIYPFIVNDPGEGTQAKRRAAGVILDHLTPPLTRAETYGPLRDLEALVDEYYEAAGVDARRAERLRKDILSLTAATGIDKDLGMAGDTDLAKLDTWLCELKEAQIRDGLHIFGSAPDGTLARDLAIAIARIPRGTAPEEASLIRALASDLGLGFDPLDCDLASPAEDQPSTLAPLCDDSWRTKGDTLERLERLAQFHVSTLILPEKLPPEAKWDGGRGDGPPAAGRASAAVLTQIEKGILPAIAACGTAEARSLLTALDGKSIPPGPSGAPTRGRLDVLPTGRNFYSVDTRAVPTPTAWSLGWASANLLIERHLQDHGDWPRALLVTAWGTANMRTGGDDIAQALALMGVKPTWDAANRRVTGFEIIPLTALGRPRVDVTLRISGFFRDAFPGLIALVDSAARAIQALDEPQDQNAATANPGPRVYGSKPGAYGAGLQALIDERLWSDRTDFAEAYLTWGSYAYGAGQDGSADRPGLTQRLSQVEGMVQNQDNREHDLLDSDDYYQFEGGAAAAVAQIQGQDRPSYHPDHSRPERPVIRTLEEEVARVVRSRAVNPKWIEGVKRHGYKGAFEIAATVDYLFAFAATTRAVQNHHFDLVEEAYIADEDTRTFIEDANPNALREIAERLQEAMDRGLWTPRSNSARAQIAGLLPATDL